jgi:phosphoribosylamine--glycine ligase
MTDGKSLSVMPPVHTAKRLGEGNQGELTEGMGGLSSGTLLPFMRQSDLDSARDCLWKLISTLKSKGVDYRGPIRGEFFVTRAGVVMLDAYATLGGVTTLNNMLLLRTQLSEVLTSVVEGSLKPLSFMERATVVKFLVPPGYPGKTRKRQFEIDERALWNNGAKAYFESVEMRDGKSGTANHGLFSGKQRTVAICAGGQSLEEAESKAEDAAASVKGGLMHRRDIANNEFVNRMIKHMALIRGA